MGQSGGLGVVGRLGQWGDEGLKEWPKSNFKIIQEVYNRRRGRKVQYMSPFYYLCILFFGLGHHVDIFLWAGVRGPA